MTTATRKLRDYQVRACGRVLAMFVAKTRRVCLVSPTGCHARGQGILMADGRICPVEEVAIGDRVASPTGPRTVLELFRGTDDMFTIRPTKGSSWTVNIDHVLTLQRVKEGQELWATRRAGDLVDVTVRDWLRWPKWRKHIHKLVRCGVTAFESHDRLPVDPYLLGILLGDGHSIGDVESTPSITTADDEIVSAFRDAADFYGLRLACGAQTGKARTYSLSGSRPRTRTGRFARNSNPLTMALRDLQCMRTCSTKRVPLAYLRASEQARLEILAGLIDTDGSVSGGTVDFISKSARLARNVAFLARSLSLAAYISRSIKSAANGTPDNAGVYWRVCISGDISRIPCRIPRKRAPGRKQKKSVLRTGFSIVPAGRGEYFGFRIDGDGRYLLDDFTITHNSGKTTMGSEIVRAAVRAGDPVVWVAHRRELVTQAAERLRGDLAAAGSDAAVGVICPGIRPNPAATIQVGTVQTLLARDIRPQARLVVLDECHHYAAAAEEFASFTAAYPDARILGLTATPARRDGSPLGDVFDDIVVAATYSELIEQGHIAPCVIQSWPPDLSASGWARDPVSAYQEHAENSIAVAFFDRVSRATEWCEKFNDAGIRAAVLSDKTKKTVRDRILSDLSVGTIRVCCNVNVLTEGTDIPALRTCIIARPYSHASQYMQACGRVLRPHPGKPHAILLDLVGAYAQHWSPTDDRIYSLTGDAIAVSRSSGFRSCPACGYPFAYGTPQCPRCEWVVPKPPAPEIKIWNVELRRVYAGPATPDDFKRKELERLLGLADIKNWSIQFVIKEYRRLFTDPPDLSIVTEPMRRKEFERLRQRGVDRGFKPGFAKVVYREIFGGWPPSTWAIAPTPEPAPISYDDAERAALTDNPLFPSDPIQ